MPNSGAADRRRVVILRGLGKRIVFAPRNLRGFLFGSANRRGLRCCRSPRAANTRVLSDAALVVAGKLRTFICSVGQYARVPERPRTFPCADRTNVRVLTDARSSVRRLLAPLAFLPVEYLRNKAARVCLVVNQQT
jgi:hypothetical protein